MKMNIKGQEIDVTECGNVKMKINSLFRSAGIKYDFPSKSSGIGINEDIVNLALKNLGWIFVKVGESPFYKIRPEKIMDIVEEYNSVYIKNDIKLMVIPIKELEVM